MEEDEADAELVWLFEGLEVDVALLPRVAKEFKKASAPARAAVTASMRKYAEGKGSGLVDKQYKFESRESTGGNRAKTVAIYTFKGWQLRVYGAEVSLEGRRVWIGSEIDISKKQDSADKAKLRRAAKNLADWNSYE